MVERAVVVRTNLDEAVEIDQPGVKRLSYRRRATARFVAVVADDEPPAPPTLGDPWEPLTVRARLHRMAEVFRRVPHTPDTRPQRERSCMPEPLREIFKDQPGEPMRLPVARADYAAACQVLDDLVKRQSRLQRVVIWGIAARQSHRQLAKTLCCSHVHAAKRIQQMLTVLAAAWNAQGWRPEQVDIDAACELIHRNIK